MAEPPDNVAGRRIESEGQFLEDQVFLRDNVIFEGHVGFEVLRVFRTHEGLHVLTNFGFVQGGADRTNLPSIPGLTMPQTNLGEAIPIKLAPGDILGLISDGIYEYENEVGLQFGQKGVASVIDAMPNGTAEELVAAIMHATRLHGGRAPQADDITIVLARRSR